MKKLSIVFMLVLILSIFLPANPSFADKYSSLVGVSVVVDNNTDITYTGKHWDSSNGTKYEYTARISQAPIYNDNGTLVDCSWHQTSESINESKRNGSVIVFPASYSITDNVFSATITGSAITTGYQGQTMSWNPVVLVDNKEYTAGSPRVIAVDPINSYYKDNTIEWDYGVCVRRVRVIEGLIQETWIFDKDPKGTVWIKDNAQKSAGFEWALNPYAYDANGNSITINEYKQVMASDLAKAVYPVTIDPTEVYVTSASDGYVYRSQVLWTYVEVHDAQSFAVLDSSGISLYFGQGPNGDNYPIYRAFVYFDTSALPDSANITACNLSLYGSDDQSATDFNMTIQSGQPTHPQDPLVAEDYRYQYYSGIGGGLMTTSFSTIGYFNISLNASGISWINLIGTTKLALRSYEDITASSPLLKEYVGVYSYEKGAGYRPTLYVTYASSGAPTVTTNPATYITKTTAQLNGYLDADGGEACTVWFYYSVNGSGTYNVTANQTGKVTGDSFITSLSGLTANTLYNYSAAAWNSFGQVNGSWQQFNTTLTLQAPTNIVCSSGSNAISLSWTKGGNTSQTYIRYKVGSYPTSTTDGNAVANQSGTDYYHTGLISGTSYYYRLWGLDGTEFSTTNSTTMCSTTAGVVNTSPNPLPTVNSSDWFNTPNASALSNNPLYPAINQMADAIGMTHNIWWLLIGIGGLVIAGIIAYTRTNKNMLLAMAVIIVAGVILSETGVFPLWTMFVFGFAGIGFAWKELR